MRIGSDQLTTLAYYSALFSVPVVVYILFFEENRNKGARRKASDWCYHAKKALAIPAINKLKRKCEQTREALEWEVQEQPRELSTYKETDTQIVHGIDREGNWIYIKIILHKHKFAELILYLKLKTGQLYKLPNEPEVLLCSIQSRQWRAEGLTLTVLEPFYRLRITYNGLLRNVNRDADHEAVEHVKFNFIWNARDKPIHYPQDIPNSVLSDVLAQEPWRDGNRMGLIGDQRGYEQFGALQGFVSGEAFPDNLVLYFPSHRKRYWGTSEGFGLHRDVSAFIVAVDGTLINVGARSCREGCAQVRYGTVLTNTGLIYAVDYHDIDIESIAENSVPEAIVIHVTIEQKTFTCVLHLSIEKATTTSSDDFQGWELKSVPAGCVVNGQSARSLLTLWYPREGAGIRLPDQLLTEPKLDKTVTGLVAPFTSRESRITALAGGKGSSLGLLSSLKTKNFKVPEGFVVLSTAFDRQLAEKVHLQESVAELEAISRGNIDGDLSEACKRVTDLFASEALEGHVSQAILEEMHAIQAKSGERSCWRWAVRSSGLSEDSEELSAAGQNATFLGCTSDEDVLRAVAACWGSLFAFQSVQYRRQHGLDVNCSMGVVVQRMVPSETAGVLFTCHPTSGDPSKLLITANYGLGESVVSGHAEPDTIELSRTWDGELSVHSQTIGSKQISISMSEDATKTTDVSADAAKTLSLSSEQSLKLGEVGAELERAYGSARDIEWAFCGGQLYLLQSRPITTLSNWTDFELLHEFDTPILSDQEFYTRANIAEVMAGAATPLTHSIVPKFIDRWIVKHGMGTDKIPFSMRTMGVSHQQAIINVMNGLLQKIDEDISTGLRVVEMAVFGHAVIDERIHGVAKAKNGVTSAGQRRTLLVKTIVQALRSDTWVRRSVNLACRFKLRLKEERCAADMVAKMVRMIDENAVIAEYHILATNGSIFFQILTMMILAGDYAELTNDHLYDISLILASCNNLVSVEIPRALEKISNIIRDHGLADKFVRIKAEDGANWLRISCPQAADELDNFLEEHGHRSQREFEFRADSWGMNPGLIIEMLKVNCKGQAIQKEQEALTEEQTIAKLLTPKNNVVRKIVGFLIGRCRRAVAQREATKSELVRMLNECKWGIRDIGKQMVREGIVPDESLVFHFSIYELKQVIKTRDPILVQKAMRRQRLYPQWDKIRLPELMFGVPKLEEDDSLIKKLLQSGEGKIRLKGTPVCPGDVVARACVINSLDEIEQLKTGDILITYSTDVGWSPYFPMLAAVVTELGGLISHGAVVAREYGLPCIVGVQSATRAFKTGDTVLLSGKVGILELVKSAAES